MGRLPRLARPSPGRAWGRGCSGDRPLLESPVPWQVTLEGAGAVQCLVGSPRLDPRHAHPPGLGDQPGAPFAVEKCFGSVSAAFVLLLRREPSSLSHGDRGAARLGLCLRLLWSLLFLSGACPYPPPSPAGICLPPAHLARGSPAARAARGCISLHARKPLYLKVNTKDGAPLHTPVLLPGEVSAFPAALLASCPGIAACSGCRNSLFPGPEQSKALPFPRPSSI